METLVCHHCWKEHGQHIRLELWVSKRPSCYHLAPSSHLSWPEMDHQFGSLGHRKCHQFNAVTKYPLCCWRVSCNAVQLTINRALNIALQSLHLISHHAQWNGKTLVLLFSVISSSLVLSAAAASHYSLFISRPSHWEHHPLILTDSDNLWAIMEWL